MRKYEIVYSHLRVEYSQVIEAMDLKEALQIFEVNNFGDYHEITEIKLLTLIKPLNMLTDEHDTELGV